MDEILNFLKIVDGKIFIGLISSLLTLLGKEFLDKRKERRRIKILKANLRGFISDSIVGTLLSVDLEYKKIKELINSGEILNGGLIKNFPWLNSSIINYFNKDDLFKVMAGIGNEEFSIFHRKLIELDFINTQSPYKISKDFNDFLIFHFKDKQLKTSIEKNKHYVTGICPEIDTQKISKILSIESRIKQVQKLIFYFTELKNKI